MPPANLLVRGALFEKVVGAGDGGALGGAPLPAAKLLTGHGACPTRSAWRVTVFRLGHG